MSRYLNLADRFGATVPGKPTLGRVPAEHLDIPREDIAILRELGAKKHAYAWRRGGSSGGRPMT